MKLAHNEITELILEGVMSNYLLTSFLGPEKTSQYDDSLRAGPYGDRIPVRERFFTFVQNCQ